MNKFFKRSRFDIKAKRRNTDEKWSEWTQVNNYEDASKHAKHIEELGYEAKIIDRGEVKDG